MKAINLRKRQVIERGVRGEGQAPVNVARTVMLKDSPIADAVTRAARDLAGNPTSTAARKAFKRAKAGGRTNYVTK